MSKSKSVVIVCTNCSATLQIKTHQQTKVITCPECKSSITVNIDAQMQSRQDQSLAATVKDPSRAQSTAEVASTTGREEVSHIRNAAMYSSITLWFAAGGIAAAGLGIITLTLKGVPGHQALFLLGGMLEAGSVITAGAVIINALAGKRRPRDLLLMTTLGSVLVSDAALALVAMASDGVVRGHPLYAFGRGDDNFIAEMNSPIPFIVNFGYVLISGRDFLVTERLVILLCAMLGIARYILVILYLRSIASRVRNSTFASSCKIWLIAYPCVVAGLFVIGVFTILIAERPEGGSRLPSLMIQLLVYGSLTGTMIWGAVITWRAHTAIRY